jgi:tetratricopeptide (TPR) repeat protein
MYRQAEGYLQIAEAVAPPDRLGELLTLLAQTHRGNGRLAQALQTAERAVQADPDNLQARHMLVNLRTEAQQFDAALLDSKTLVDLAKRQVRESPGDVEKVRELYAAYEARLNVWRALHQTLYVMNPDGTRSDELIPGREAQAAETIRQIVDLLTYQAELRLILAQYEMITFAEKAVAYAPDNPDVLLQLALLLENTSQLDRARAVYQRVLELDRENEQARRRLHALGGTPTAAAASQPTQQ